MLVLIITHVVVRLLSGAFIILFGIYSVYRHRILWPYITIFIYGIAILMNAFVEYFGIYFSYIALVSHGLFALMSISLLYSCVRLAQIWQKKHANTNADHCI